MNLVIWFVAGALLGWGSGQFDYQRIFWHTVLGVAGGIMGGVFFAPLFGVAPTPHAFNDQAFLVSLLCAFIVLGLAHIFWHKSGRRVV